VPVAPNDFANTLPAQATHTELVAVAADIHLRTPFREVQPGILRQAILDTHRGQNSVVVALVRAVAVDRAVDTFYLVMSIVAEVVVVTAAAGVVVAVSVAAVDLWRGQENGGGNLFQTFGRILI